MKKADKSGASVCLIIGENEAACGTVTVKFLRSDQTQQTLPLEQAVELLRNISVT